MDHQRHLPGQHGRVLPQQGHRPLGHHRGSGHGVDHRSRRGRRGHQVTPDVPVHLVEGVGAFVVVIEGSRIGRKPAAAGWWPVRRRALAPPR